LFDDYSHEVGAVLKKNEPIIYKDYESTDCITYSLRVVSDAFTKRGNKEAARRVWRLGGKGTELAKYLVNSHN